MSQRLPWSIEDLEPDTRDAARRAARRAGMSVDDWLDMTMRDQDRAGARTTARYEDMADEDELARDLAYGGRNRPDTASHRFAPSRLSPDEAEALLAKAAASDRRARESDTRTAQMLESITRWMEKTENRIVAGERNSSVRQERTASVMADAIKTVGSRLNDVERRAGDERRAFPELRSSPERRVAPRMASPPLSKANFADAVAEIRARQRDLEGHAPSSRRAMPQDDGYDGGSAHDMGRSAGHDAAGDPGIRALRDELRALSTGMNDRAIRADGQDEMRAELLRLRRDIAQGANRSTAEMASTLSALINKLDKQPRVVPGDQLSRTLMRLENDVAKLAAGRGAGGEAIERQIARLHQRLDQMGAQSDGAALSGLAREMAEIKSRVGSDMGGRIAAMASELVALRQSQIDPNEFVALRAALQQSRPSAPADHSGEIGHILRQVEGLSQRMDTSRGLSASELDARMDRIMQRIDQLPPASALESRLDDIQAALEKAQPPVSATLERQIEALGARLENLAASNGLVQVLASDGKPVSADLRPIEKMLKQIHDRVEHFERPDTSHALSASTHSADAFAALSRQIQLLSERPEPEPHVPDFSPIETMLHQLQQQFEKASQPDSGQPAIHALERQIANLAQRIDDWSPPASDTQIDKTLRELVGSVDALRQGGSPSADAVVRAAIENGLGDLKASQSGIENRIQSSFSTVQDAMERIAARLSMLEVEGPEPRRAVDQDGYAQAQPSSRDPLSHERAALADALMLEPAMQASAARARVQVQPPKTQAATAAVDHVVREAAAQSDERAEARAQASRSEHATRSEPAMDIPAPRRQGPAPSALPAPNLVDQPLEPGSGRPQQAGRQAQPGRDMPAPAMASGSDPQTIKANYIAAARRAVQTAAAEAKAASGDERAPKTGKMPSPSKVKALFEKRKKPILLGLAAAIIAMGSAQVISNALFAGPAPEPKMSAAKPEKPAQTKGNDDTAARQSALATEKRQGERAEPRLEPRTEPSRVSAVITPNKLGSVMDPALMSQLPPDAQATAPLPSGQPAPQLSANFGPSSAVAAVPAEIQAPSTVAAVTGVPEIGSNLGTPGLRKAARGGDARAVFDLATRMADGRGMPRDAKLALKLFERAAAAGLVPAQFRIGNMYEKGIGTNKDAGLARLWYERAAEKGNSKAMHNLAVLYAEGVTGKPDYPLATEWFKKAADHGVRDSQYNLAILLARGLGSAQDLPQSYQWFAVAAAQGDEDAGKKRDEVALKLAPAELATAKVSTEQWRAKPVDLQANEVSLPAKGWDEPLALPAPTKKPVRNSQG